MFFFLRGKRKAPKADAAPFDPEPESPDLEGDFPPHYNHNVRICVKVERKDVPLFRTLLKSRQWPLHETKKGRYHVYVPRSGAALRADRSAVSDFEDACSRAGVHTNVLSAHRIRARRSPSSTYLVIPRKRIPEREPFATLARLLSRRCSIGRINAPSLTKAESQLPEFTTDHPGAGTPDELIAIGPPDDEEGRGTTEKAPLYGAVLLSACQLAFLLTLPLHTDIPPPPSIPTTILSIIGLLCLIITSLVAHQTSERKSSVWLTLVLTAAFPAVSVSLALAAVIHNSYLWGFGIRLGEVAFTGLEHTAAAMHGLPKAVAALIICTGLFATLRYFHFIGNRNSRVAELLALSFILFFSGLCTVFFLGKKAFETGEAHVAAYQEEGGAPREYAGLLPSVVCVEPGEGPVKRFGPPLTTDRPVLHFTGANSVDLLWDREKGLTRVPRFSVVLTPVADLDASCPAPSGGASAEG